jgi:hypothetical protein
LAPELHLPQSATIERSVEKMSVGTNDYINELDWLHETSAILSTIFRLWRAESSFFAGPMALGQQENILLCIDITK